MDCSWLLEEADWLDKSESEKSDSEEIENELESRLYGIVHHNDLSKPLPLELAKHYSLHSDNGDVMVALNHSLDQLKSEESEEIDKTLDLPNLVDEDLEEGEIVVISDEETAKDIIDSRETKNQYAKKRFRYSDVNIDKINESQQNEANAYLNNVQNPDVVEVSDVNVNDVKNVLKYFQGSHINIPACFQYSTCKSDCNGIFNTIEDTISETQLRSKMKKALRRLNPKVNKRKLFHFTDIQIKINSKFEKRLKKKGISNALRNNLLNWLNNITFSSISKQDNSSISKETNVSVINDKINNRKSQQKNRKNKEMYINLSHSLDFSQIDLTNGEEIIERRSGSVSLNTSPFRPSPLLVGEEPEDRRWASTNILPSHIPTKWSKKMIAFYTKPFKEKMKINIENIFHKFNRTTTPDDWWLDPRDERGIYHPSKPMKKQTRCSNCKRRGHNQKECPEKKRHVVCYLCGDYNHTGYSCKNTICWKCGVLSPEGECMDCYYHTFQYNMLCERCGSALHRTPNCPDSWRSFHLTTEGELKIPETMEENQRKYCCNCARKGHFSHTCPVTNNTGHQTNPFISNYSNLPFQEGATEICVPKEFEEIISSPDADYFLQRLSDTSNTKISLGIENNLVRLTVIGTFQQCINVRSEIQDYMNTRKRKREEPSVRRKRRRLH